MTKFQSILIPLALVSATPLNAAIVQYTSRTAFLNALPGSPLTTDFSALPPGDQLGTTLTIFGSSGPAALVLETRDAANINPGNNLWLSDTGNLDTALGATTTYSDQLRLGNGGFFAIGADWFLGDLDDNYLAGSVILTFSDNTTFIITSTSQANSFSGFISDTPLTSVLVRPSNPTGLAGWATIDNVVAVPEPSAIFLGGIAGLGVMLRRNRNA